MAHNLSRYRQHQLLMGSPASRWCDGWRLHVSCYGPDCAMGRYKLVRDLVQRWPDDTLQQMAGRAFCRGCGSRPSMVWLARPALGNRLAERVNLIGGVG